MSKKFVAKVHDGNQGNLVQGFFNKMQEFEAYLINEGKSEKTIEAYMRDMKFFHEFLEEINGDLNNLVRGDVQDYITLLENGDEKKGSKKQAVATVERKFNSIRMFCEFTDQLNAVHKIRRIKKQRVQSEDFDMLERLELKAVLRTAERVSKQTGDLKPYALINLLAYTGIRIEEAAELSIDSCDFKRGGGLTVLGKGNKKRVTVFPNEAKLAIEEYLESRTDDCPALFVNNRKNPEKLSKRGLQRIVEEVRAYHNLNKKKIVHFSAHTFRHSFARYWLVDEGKDPVTVAEWMGHSSLEMTRQYARFTTKQQREEAEDFVI